MKSPHRWMLLGVLIILGVVVIYGCNSKKKNPMGPGGGVTADVTVTITGINGNMSFSPNPANVTAGQTVAWRNNGGTTHTATEDGGSPLFNTGNIANGTTSTPITISTTGDLTYHCEIHPTMVGTLHVVP